MPPFVAVCHDESPAQAKPVPCARMVSSSANSSRGQVKGGGEGLGRGGVGKGGGEEVLSLKVVYI